jgi:hypothetical protein
MKRAFLLLLFIPLPANAQSPFDGTWRIDQTSLQLPAAPARFLLLQGAFECSGCLGDVSAKADGRSHKIPDSAYWNAATVRVINRRCVRITTHKDGKIFYAETDTLSPDGNDLIQFVQDTTEAEAVTTTVRFHRIEKAPPGAHQISGSWQAYKIEKSPNSLIISYKCTKEGFSAETPLGEKYQAKFDGEFVQVEDDPGQTMVAVKRIDERTVETTIKRAGQIAGGSRLTVSVDGQTLCFLHRDASGKQTGSVVMHRQP